MRAQGRLLSSPQAPPSFRAPARPPRPSTPPVATPALPSPIGSPPALGLLVPIVTADVGRLRGVDQRSILGLAGARPVVRQRRVHFVGPAENEGHDHSQRHPERGMFSSVSKDTDFGPKTRWLLSRCAPVRVPVETSASTGIGSRTVWCWLNLMQQSVSFETGVSSTCVKTMQLARRQLMELDIGPLFVHGLERALRHCTHKKKPRCIWCTPSNINNNTNNKSQLKDNFDVGVFSFFRIFENCDVALLT